MNTNTEKNAGGRPTSFKAEYVEQTYKLCLLGSTDKQLADFFNVAESTVNLWKLKQPKFLDALRRGKTIADMQVASALYKSATGGHVIKEDKLVSDGEGGQKILTLEKQLEPSVSAQIFWLKNRQHDKWRDKVHVDSNVKIDKELLAFIETEGLERLAKARERQREILRERGLLDDDD